MNVKILAVESGKEADSLDVLLSIGEEKKSFRFIISGSLTLLAVIKFKLLNMRISFGKLLSLISILFLR